MRATSSSPSPAPDRLAALPRLALSFLLFLLPIASAAATSVPGAGAGRVIYALNCVCSQARAIMPPIAMLLVVGAAVVYGAGKLFGSEMGSKASSLAAFMLVAAILSVALSVAGPDILRMMYNDPAMTAACDASACVPGPLPAPPPLPAPAPADGASLFCGAVLNLSNRAYVLSDDLGTRGAGSCLRVEADNVSIDCRGYWLRARTPGAGAGQYGIFTNATNTTIANCRIRDFGYGIRLEAARGSHVLNNTVLSDLSGGRGIFLGASRLGAGSTGNDVSHNTVRAGSSAIYMEYSRFNVLSHNNLSGHGGTLALVAAESNSLSANQAEDRSGPALLLSSGSNRNLLQGNEFLSGGDGAMVVDSLGNVLEGNNFSASSEGAALGLQSEPGMGAENLVWGNYFLSGGRYISNDGTDNFFNTTRDGQAVGNRYAGLDLSMLADDNADGWADNGTAYPYSASTSRGKWAGVGADWGPAMAR